MDFIKHVYAKNSAILTVTDNRSIHFFLSRRAVQSTVHDASNHILTVRVSDLDFSPTRNGRDCFKSRPLTCYYFCIIYASFLFNLSTDQN
jgi:hypothetical protein